MRVVLILFFLLFLAIVALTNFTTPLESILLLSASLILYNGSEIYLLSRRKWRYFLINPVVLGVIVVFGFYFGGISNFYLSNGGSFYIKEPAAVLNSEHHWLKYFMLLANLGSVFVWVGYYLPIAGKINEWMIQTLPYSRFQSIESSRNRILVLFFLAVGIKFYLFSIGLQGRLVTTEYFEAGVGYKLGSQIRILGELLPLILVLTGYLSMVKKKKEFKYIFFGCFVVEVFFGFVYGARGPIIIPFFIAFFLSYLGGSVLKWYHVAIFVFVLLFSFTVVADFKNYSQRAAFSKSKSANPFKVIDNFAEFQEGKRKRQSYANMVDETLLNSVNFVAEGSMAIRHKELIGLKETDINFKRELLNVPVDAFIPRFLQTNKNAPTWGYWFKNKVMKYQPKLKWSMGMSLVGNLYFTGGVFMIFIGFLVNGILYRLAFINLQNGLIGTLVALTLFQTLVQDEVFVNQCINALRYIFIYPWLFYLLLKKY